MARSCFNIQNKSESNLFLIFVHILQEKGVNAIVIIVHDGTEADYYSGNTKNIASTDKTLQFGHFLAKRPNAVDLVVTGHTCE